MKTLHEAIREQCEQCQNTHCQLKKNGKNETCLYVQYFTRGWKACEDAMSNTREFNDDVDMTRQRR